MRIFRTAPYIRATQKLFSEEALRAAEAEIAANPERWPVMPRTGGCRKARVALAGRGKSGGARMIYFFREQEHAIFMMTAYPKNRQENVSRAEEEQLKRIVKEILALDG